MHMYKAYIQLKSLRKTSTLTGVSKSTIQRWATTNPIVLRSQKARKATTEAVQRIVELVSSLKLVKGAINSHIFSEFMATLDTHERDVMLLDNCSIHKTQTAQDAMISRGLTPLFLPPYSPEFQPSPSNTV